MINYGFFDTSLGQVLLAATPSGLCSLRMCEFHGADAQLAEVKSDFSAHELFENPEAIRSYADQLILFLQKPKTLFTPTLDVCLGTAFQRAVWAELQKVKPGETITYTELAVRVGRPLAVRAAASACAQNGLAIAIPCHRAVRRDGTLSGFRWGLQWKKSLLAWEADGSLPGITEERQNQVPQGHIPHASANTSR